MMNPTIRPLLLATLLVGLAGTVHAQVRINEVGILGVDHEGAQKWVELYNAGDTTVDVAQYFLCNFPVYPRINSLSLLSGNTNLAPGEYLVVAWDDPDDTDAEVGLYLPSTTNFGSASSIVDYMQYGEAGHFRESTAVAAGVWEAGAFVPLPDSGRSMSFVGGGQTATENWATTAPTPGEANGAAVAVENDFPGRFRLLGNYPNPFNPTTTIRFELNHSGPVSLAVYNVLGKKIVDLLDEVRPSGSYQVEWDGRDENGMQVSTGVYLYRLTFDGREQRTRAMTLLR